MFLVNAMSELRENKEIGGSAFHVRDCYIWAEIHYLDSSTDYRECLPQKSTKAGFGELVMLDSGPPHSTVGRISFAVFLTGVASLLALAGLFLYSIVQNF